MYFGLKKIADIKADGREEYYITDHLGTVNAVLDKDAATIQQYAFDPYGNMEYAQGRSDNRYLFTGKEYDAESGVFYFGARYYDSKAGRWLARDPKEEFFSSYVYAANNPLLYIDPNGEWTIQLGAGGTAGGGTGITGASGFVFGFSYKNGIQFGTYETGGGGPYAGFSVSGTLDFSFSLNENIHDLSGPSIEFGGSGGEGVAGGLSISIPASILSGASPSFTISVGGGIGSPGEAHGFLTTTAIQQITLNEILFDAVDATFGGIEDPATYYYIFEDAGADLYDYEYNQ